MLVWKTHLQIHLGQTKSRRMESSWILSVHSKYLHDRKIKHKVFILSGGTIDLKADSLTDIFIELEEENKRAVIVLM